MASSTKGTSLLTDSGIGLLIVLALGAGLGFVFSGDLFANAPSSMMIGIGLGIVWAGLIVNWVDIVIQTLGLTSDPVPEALELSDPESVQEYLTSPAGSSAMAIRAHRLLNAVGNGASGAQVAQQAAAQSQQAHSSFNGFVISMLILLAAALWDGSNTLLTWGGLVFLAITIGARKTLLSKIDAYLENAVVSRTTTGASAAAPAAAPGKSGEDIARAIQSAFSGMKGDLAKLADSVGGFSEKLNSVGDSWGSDLSGVLSQHADSVQGASQALAQQLDRILSMQKDIDKVLKVGDAVDKVAESVNATAEFQQTLAALRSHVEETDKVLKELSKPRKIRLVEGQAAS